MTDDMHSASDTPDEAPQPAAGPRPSLTAMSRSPGLKFFMIGFISLALLVPALLVWGLTEERASRAAEISARIAQGWGGPQTINGPYLAVPFYVNQQSVVDGKTVWQSVTNWALIMPEKLNIDAGLTTEERRLSIYKLPVYNSKITLSGSFPASLKEDVAGLGGQPDMQRAMLVMNIGDISGIRSDAAISIDGGEKASFQPGMKSITATSGAYVYGSRPDSGIHFIPPADKLTSGFDFAIDLSLNGSSSFAVAPAGQTTVLTARANWPHPGFEGRFLPEEKTIAETGFDAKWTIPYLARGVDRVVLGSDLPLSDSLMTVNLVEPVKFYQVVSRTLKYAIAFISVVFLAVFIIELKSDRMVHWIQYVLTGLALIIFYIMLLALAEHTGFEIAYLVASVATILLIASYVAVVLESWKSGILLGLVLTLAYAVMYLILREDEYALLAGALISFVTIAATMYSTRNIDWSTGGNRKKAGQEVTPLPAE
ncbi:cell envelope integrity protein CreD [Rhizobium sp. LjRoot30]|uniref:cell envelope integrity protein CreD n=1 Tax=Rhizobium sp. LjRoot30 TaxID=3342320 RepID=UPI003ECF21FB